MKKISIKFNNFKYNIYLSKLIIILFCIYQFKFNLNNNKEIPLYFNNSIYNNYPKIELNDNNIPLINDIFNSNILYINDSNLTPEYITHFKKIHDEREIISNIKNNTNICYNKTILRKDDKINWIKFYKICKSEKLIEPINNIKIENPLISIILPSFNKKKEILGSIRSIQNQSFKNIEIIIVDDCSTDKIIKIYNQLLKEDSRIRIFYHIKNLGVWRSRLDGLLYSKGKYIIFFDPGDFYSDNLILEDAYNIIIKNNLDSLRFSFKMVKNKKYIKNNSLDFILKSRNKVILGYKKYYVNWYTHGTIWNRLIRKNILLKSLQLIDSFILNAYKNLWEDRWWNTLANINSYRSLYIKRIGYIYIKEINGEGILKINNEKLKDKTIHEVIYFWLFDLQLLPKKDNKKSIINILKKFNNKNYIFAKQKLNLYELKYNFTIYKHLLKLLINDPYIYRTDKLFVKKLLNKIK